MKFLNFWDCLRGKTCSVQFRDGRTINFLNFWEFLNYLREQPFQIPGPDSSQQPDLPALKSSVEANPTDPRARMQLGAHLHTAGSFDEAYQEYLEAIALLSNVEGMDDISRRLSFRAFARRMTAKVLEDIGRDADARQQWQGCADDIQAAMPDQKYLSQNPHYLEAMDKIKS